MNLVIDDAVEVTLAKQDSPEERRKLGAYTPCCTRNGAPNRVLFCMANIVLGQVLLKGDNISLIQQINN